MIRICVMAILRSFGAEVPATSKNALPTKKTISSAAVKPKPTETGLPGSDPYTLNVKGVIYELESVEELWWIAMLDRPRGHRLLLVTTG